MKGLRLFLILGLVISLAAPIMGTPTQTIVPGNLLANPGFEQVTGGFPASWRTFDQKARSLASVDRQEAFAGKYSLRLTGDPAEAWLPLFSSAFKVQPGSEYTLACYCKSAIKHGNGILFALREIDADGQSIRFSRVPIPLQADWAFYSRKIKLSDKTTSIQVFIILQNCEGTAWFDDLMLVKGDLPDLAALRARRKQPAEGKAAPETPLYRNLLPDNGFEQAGGDKLAPAEWTFVGTSGQAGTVDRQVAFAGEVSFRQQHPAAGLPGSYLRPVAPIPVTPNAIYRLAAWLRTSVGAHSGWTSIPRARGQRVEGAGLQLLFLDDSGVVVSQVWSRPLQTNGQWQQVSVVGRSPGNASTAEVRLFQGDMRGSSWFDATQLARVATLDDLEPLWALPKDIYDPGPLPPGWQTASQVGEVQAALSEGAAPDSYSVMLRCTGPAAAGELRLPAVDTSFPGRFKLSGECRHVAGTGQAHLHLVSLDVNGRTLSQKDLPLSPGDKWGAFSFDYTPDPMAACFTTALAVKGQGLAVELRGARATRLSTLSLKQYMALPTTSGTPAPAPAAATRALPKISFASRDGVPTLTINGVPTSLDQYWYSDPVADSLIRAAGRVGLIHVITLSDIDWSKDPAGIDYAALDQQVRRVLSLAPRAWIILCPDTTTVQGKIPWVKYHPAERYVNGPGETSVKAYSGDYRSFPSMASLKWQAAVNQMLTELIGHVKGSDYAEHVIGYQLSGYEWFQWEWSSHRMDCSVPMRDAFRRWLRQRYDTRQALQAAWGRPGVDFSTVQLPSQKARRRTVDGVFRDPVTQRDVIDFSRFYNQLVANVLIGQARTVKQAAGPDTLVSCFYGYVSQMFDSLARESSGHLALKHLLDSGLISFTIAPSDGYIFERGLGGTGGFMTLPGTYPLHGALYVDQPDYRTHWSPQDIERTATIGEDVSIFRRELALTLTNDVPIQYLDFSRGWTMGDRRLVQQLRACERIERFAQTLDRRPTGDGFAVVVSERAADYIGTDRDLFYGALLYHQRPLYFRSGMPHRYYLLSDLANPAMPDYKLYIFPNAFRLTAADRAMIKRKCMRNGNVLVFEYAPGYVSKKSASLVNVESFLGLKMGKFAQATAAQVTIAPAVKLPWLRDSVGLTYGHGDWSPLFYVDDARAQVLGKFVGQGKAGLVLRDFGNYKVVYSGAPLLPPDLLRDLGRLAGANIYVDSGDALYADRNFVGLHARTPGLKTIHLPYKTDVYDVFHKRVVARQVDSFQVPMKGFDTALFYLGDANRAERYFGRAS